jgi:hypothetical protein
MHACTMRPVQVQAQVQTGGLGRPMLVLFWVVALRYCPLLACSKWTVTAHLGPG